MQNFVIENWPATNPIINLIKNEDLILKSFVKN
jgi:hypothetical protein